MERSARCMRYFVLKDECLRWSAVGANKEHVVPLHYKFINKKMEFDMKTGSFSMPQLICNKSLQLVSGGTSPNDPAPVVNNPINLIGAGGSNLHSAPDFTYGLSATVHVTPNLNIQANMAGNAGTPVMGFSIVATRRF